MRKFGYCRLLLQLTAGLSAVMFLSSTAMAADLAPVPTKAIALPAPVLNPWTFTATPYGWVPLMNGSITVKGRTADINVGLSDISTLVRNSEIPKELMELVGYFEARNGRFSVFADLLYFKAALGASMVRSRGTDEINGTVGVAVSSKNEIVIAEMAAAYEIARWGTTNAPGSGTAIDVFAGARGWWLNGDATVSATGTANIGDLTRNADGTLTASGSVGWVDPLVGVRLRHQFMRGWNFTASGDVGGFGVGSKYSWQALATLNYGFYVSNSVTWSGMLGYKALRVDYSKGSGLNHFEYNMTMQGPIIGVTARF